MNFMSQVATKQGKAKIGAREKFDFDPRYFLQTAQHAMKSDVVRGLVELITNADDSYGRLEDDGQTVNGDIVVSLERRRKGKASIVTVQDFAEGMSGDNMVDRLRRVGGATSGFEASAGRRVRGTMGRGSKECVVFGSLTFCSIKGGRYAMVRLDQPAHFTLVEDRIATQADRVDLGFPRRGNGTVVTLEVGPTFSVPMFSWLRVNLAHYVSLRDIASSSDRRLLLHNVNTKSEPVQIKYSRPSEKPLFEKALAVPGYLEAEAKLVLYKSSKRIKVDLTSPYWSGGVEIKSGHAIHGLTLFSRDIENNPYAEFYFGRLSCPYIDKLQNEFEEAERKRKTHSPINPSRVIDPLRDGLDLDHPFTTALYSEAAHVLREQLKQDEEEEQSRTREIESKETAARLRKLAGAVSRYMKEKMAELEGEEDANDVDTDALPIDGLAVIPGGAVITQGSEARFYVYVRSRQHRLSTYNVNVSTKSEEISLSHPELKLKQDCNNTFVTSFVVRGEKPVSEAPVKLTWGAVDREVLISVITEKTSPELTEDFSFEKPFYSIREGKTRAVRLLAKCPDFIRGDVTAVVMSGDEAIKIINERVRIKFDRDWRAGVGVLRIKGVQESAPVVVTAEVAGRKATARFKVLPRPDWGQKINIKIRDEFYGEQRAVWDRNTLKIAGRHPSIKRYLGSAEDNFPNQETLHFRLLVAELVADNVAKRIMESSAQRNIAEFEDLDVTGFYRKHRQYMGEILNVAHSLQVADGELERAGDH